MAKKWITGFALATLALSASATVLDFEGIQFTQFQANVISGYSLANTNSYINGLSTNYPGYGNFKWSQNGNLNDFRVVEAAGFLARNPGTPANNGITNGLVSGNWVAVNGGGADVWFETLTPGSTAFNFESAYMSAAWYNGLKVDVTGYRNGVVQATKTVTLSYTAALQEFNMFNVDKVVFHSQQDSGTVIDNQSTYNHAFVMDNLSVTAVPEPQSYALMLVSLGLIGAAARRTASQRK